MPHVDDNLMSFVGPADDYVTRTGLSLDATGKDDALKFSNVKYPVIREFAIIGGREDCIDCNRGIKPRFLVGDLSPRGKYAVTLKGGLQDYEFQGIRLFGHGRLTDFNLGDWSDQARSFGARTTGGQLINVRTLDNSPIRIRCLNADKPVTIDCSPIQWQVYPKVFVWCYWQFQRLVK